MFLNFFWRRLLKVPWTARNSNQSILKEINLEYSLEGLMLRLKLHCFGHMIRRTDSLERTLMLGKIESRRRRGWQRMRWLMASPTQWTWIWGSSGCWWWTGNPGVLQFMGSQRVRHDWVPELNCSPPGSSVHGIFQARILEWIAMLSSRGSSHPRNRTCDSCLLLWQAGFLPLAPPAKHMWIQKWVGICITDSFCCTAETNTAW